MDRSELLRLIWWEIRTCFSVLHHNMMPSDGYPPTVPFHMVGRQLVVFTPCNFLLLKSTPAVFTESTSPKEVFAIKLCVYIYILCIKLNIRIKYGT